MMAGSLVVDTFAEPPTGWDVDPLTDQGVAGGSAWAFGELPTVLVLAVVSSSPGPAPATGVRRRWTGQSTGPVTPSWRSTTPDFAHWPI